MKKLKLLLALFALLVGTNVSWAQGWTASAPATGNFYLYNVGANAYIENGSSWGTHSALKSSGFVLNITAANGVYTIGTSSKYPGKFFTDNGYVDTGGSTNWIFEAVPGLTNTYYLKTAAGNYAYAAAGMYNVEIGSNPGTNKAYWKLVTADNRDNVSGASATNPIELTHKINNPRFDDNNSGWQDVPARGGNTMGTNNNVPSYDDRNPCAEHYNKTYDTYQELTGLSNGVYAVSVQGFYREGGFTNAASKHNAGTESLNAILYANSAEQPLMSIFEEAGKASGGGTVTTDGISGAFPNDMAAASYFFSANLYWNVVYVEVTDGTLKFGVKKSTAVGADWTIFDNFRLQYFGNSCTIAEAKLGPSISALAAAVSEAQAYIDSNPALSANHIAALQNIVDNNDNDDNAFTTKEQYEVAIENIETALVVYKAMVAPYASFNVLKTSVNAIAAVEYKETTSGSHATFTSAITTQTSAADNATTAAAITEATTALKDAIRPYIAGAEPKNDGEYFDITCLMTNPNFDDSHNGWTYLSAPGVSWSNCEYYQSEFDINQTVTGLPTGSYSLSVQAFQRPGWAGNVYNDYVNGTDNASSVLYINSITSNVKNIAADAQNTYKLGDGSNFDWPNDSRVGSEGSYKFVPNSQEGAKLWFEAGLYDATCAAVVTDEDGGSLKLGFKSTKTHVGGDWTIFDNFRLYYYGSSKMIYYKQYLPQLEAEIATNYLNNAAYDVLKDGQTERASLVTANSADANSLNTEEELENAINAITTARDAFANAKTAFENLAADIAASTYNVGDGVFQMNSANKATYDAAVSAGNTMYTTGTASLAEVTAQILAIKNAYVLNAPVAGTRYNLIVANAEHAKNGNAVIIVPGNTSESNPSGYGLNANYAPNANLAQTVSFTKVSGNDYTINFVTAEGTAYLTYGVANGSTAGHKNYQIQATTDASKKGEFTIVATNTANVFNIVNKVTNTNIDCQEGGNIYTDENITLDGFSVAEASQATVNVSIAADVKYATRIFPFAPELPEGVKAYTCDATNEILELTEVVTPEANIPYILVAEDGCATDLKGWGVLSNLNPKAGGDDNHLTGVYVAQKAPADSYVLQNQNDKVAFYLVAENDEPTVGAYRCYLTAPSNVESRAAFYFDKNETTAIRAIEALTSGDTEIFNAAGARVPVLQKGLNIVKRNDKSYKVIVK